MHPQTERSFHFRQKYDKIQVSKNKPFCDNAVLKLLAPYYGLLQKPIFATLSFY